MPTDQKVTGLSPVGVTLKTKRLQIICNLFFISPTEIHCGIHGRHRTTERRIQDSVPPGLLLGGDFPIHPIKLQGPETNFA